MPMNSKGQFSRFLFIGWIALFALVLVGTVLLVTVTPGPKKPTSLSACGNQVCESSETVGNCIQDCFVCNNNGQCENNLGENQNSCPNDCPPTLLPACNNNETCDSGENQQNCPNDCTQTVQPRCGDGTCNGSETCSTCASDCGSCPPICGNGTCETGETTQNCPVDCVICNNNGNCETNRGENQQNCPNDCPPTVCTEGQQQNCNKNNSFGTCSGIQACQQGQWGDCNAQTPAQEICDTKDNDCDGKIDEDCFLLTYWAPYIDGSEIRGQWQAKYLPAFVKLQEIGFSHVGIHVWGESADVQRQLRDLRDLNMLIALHDSSGHWFMDSCGWSPGMDDPQQHSTGVNLKYFDTPGFNPLACTAAFDEIPDQCCNGTQFVGGQGCPAQETCRGCLCRLKPSSEAVDPFYSGTVWQRELLRLRNLLQLVQIGSKDAVLLDVEIWNWKPTQAEEAYPNVLLNNMSHYSGDLNARFAQHYGFWRQRGLDLKNAVKQFSPQTKVFFYNENPSKIAQGIRNGIQNWDWAVSAMPHGTGDVASPSLYYAPNLAILQQELDADDYTNAVAWASFSASAHNGYSRPLYWDPLISQKMGFWLRQRGIKGLIVYPGPFDDGVPIEYYYAHAESLLKGFLEGEDPGELVEICNDNWDNDGDGEWDEQPCQNS